MKTDCRRTDAPADEPLDDPRLTQALEEYLAALEAGQKPDRRAWLARYPDIAASLESCLQSLNLLHSTAPQLLPPAAPPAVSSPLPGDAAEPLGDFRILREVGRGGMGVVYEATQLSLGRRVALKVLPFAAALDQRQLQRFRNEAQAAAHLHHSNIVPVFGVGCERGVYYYAMQFIEGRTVSAFIRETRQRAGLRPAEPPGLSSAPTRSAPVVAPGGESRGITSPDPGADSCRLLPTAAPPSAETARAALTSASAGPGRDAAYHRLVARLGVQAAEALESAHQQGIVHRDVKPANLLLDAHEHLWVTDFGLARVQSDAGLTLSGDLVGTLRYMSPEQALAKRGLVDHRTDIYSLGATLYELLTLEPVFDGADRQELLRQIAFDEPRPPRAVCKAVPCELETIVLKALAKAPEERYGAAQELADDLRRYLEDRPILARRPGLRERAAKWLRRHRSVAAAAFAGLFLTAVVLAVSTVLVAREQANTQAAYQAEAEQRARADAQRKRAEESFRQARQAVDYFAQVCEEDMADRPEMQAVRRRLLEGARQYYQAFIDLRSDDPTTQAELAESYLRVASILNDMGDRAEARAAAERAARIQEKRLLDNPSDPEVQRGLSSIYHALGLLRGGSQVMLLTQKSVQDDLCLNDDQKGRITPLANARHEAFREFHNKSPEAWKRKLDELAEQEKALPEILTPEQYDRLAQIDLQLRGPFAFNERQVAAELGLTDEQEQAIRSIQASATASLGGPPRPGQRHDWKKADDWGKALKEQLLNVLTPQQKAKWKELTGEPFKGELRHGHFGHGPPPWAGPPRK